LCDRIAPEILASLTIGLLLDILFRLDRVITIRKQVQGPTQDGRSLALVIRGQGLEIKVEHDIGALFAKMPPLSAEVFVAIHDPVGGDGIGDALDLDLAVLLTADLVSNMGEGLVGDQDLTRPAKRKVAQTIAMASAVHMPGAANSDAVLTPPAPSALPY
jgi:hypothetical protein